MKAYWAHYLIKRSVPQILQPRRNIVLQVRDLPTLKLLIDRFSIQTYVDRTVILTSFMARASISRVKILDCPSLSCVLYVFIILASAFGWQKAATCSLQQENWLAILSMIFKWNPDSPTNEGVLTSVQTASLNISLSDAVPLEISNKGGERWLRRFVEASSLALSMAVSTTGGVASHGELALERREKRIASFFY